ncbi:Cyanate permease [Haloechinothrix alba]|uniref:Cyanate permease n=1 Tax=Haloechinothrix alba TaxID=664784 RepID=A0A238XAY9_9PSEU|nr:Cyanate permease [Haloechinothrix alba]
MSGAGAHRALAVLCLTEVTSWGVLFYAFPVLAPEIAAGTGWPAAAVMAALSAGQLVAALVGIPVGRWLDRHGPRLPMTAGALLGVVALLGVASAQNLVWFFAAWLVAGVAMGAVLYPPAFAALTRWYGQRLVFALTVLTLAAGLASTVFAPLTAALAGWLGWRGSYLVLAGILAVITIPGHWFGLDLPWPQRQASGQRQPGGDPASVARGPAFILLTIALSIAAFATFAALINLVPVLVERGAGLGTAATALGLGGAGQLLGRIGYAPLTRRTGVRSRTALILLAIAATTTLLGVLTPVPALLAAAVLAGTARGVFTLLHATAVSDRWGTAHYGRLTGLLSAPVTIATALAPFAGSALATLLGSYAMSFLALGAMAAFAGALSLASIPPGVEHRRDSWQALPR